ncbi:oligosaccharide flippase family protein [Loktanella salsilacus]|uniref:oligosaccharide flippase family protein n=1 Tax=Loktanella salsilacus TaxID=195913 RepID=UPI0020B687EE|nr:oligosaccharide flippase family protein [Loktanella salsilacus]UTH46207.1 oligosaccharide flippase family protein [Loktanella salsilacus]
MLRSFLSVSIVYVVGVPLTLFVNIILARWLSVDQFGLYSFTIAIATFIAIPVSGGLPMLLTREVSGSLQSYDTPTYQRAVSAAIIWVMSSSLLALSVAGTFIWLFEPERAGLFFMALAMVPAIGLISVGEGTLKGVGKPAVAEASRQLLVPPIMLIGIFVVSRAAPPAAVNVLMANLVAYAFVAFATLTLTYVLSPLPLQPALADKTRLLHWGSALLSFALISGMATLSTQFATLLLGLLGQQDQVAYLRVAERGAQLVAFPLMFINAVLGPKVVAAHRSGDSRALHTLSRQAARITLIVSAPLGLVLIIFGRQLIGLTFGENYVSGSYAPLVILIVGQLVSVSFGSPGLFLMMSGFERSSIYAQVGGLSVMIALVIALSSVLGAYGASIGVALGLFAINFLASLATSKKLGFFPGAVSM